jgi:D,D-heptose 1,7-bisphosphate phosphatase
MQLVILAGGKGTRLGLTDIPKPMIKIAGKPLLQYQVELAKRYGITEIFILSGYLANVIVDYFGDGSAWGIKIHHIIEPRPLGTAGALKQLDGMLKDRFLVFYGDIIMDFDISFFAEFDKEAPYTIGTLFAHPNDHPHDSDLIEVDSGGYVKSLLPKPHNENEIYHNLVSAAVYILSPRILKYIESGIAADFGKDIFPMALIKGEKLRAYISPEYIKDMGTKKRLEEVSCDLENGKVRRYNRVNKRPAIFLDRDGTINRDMDSDISFDNFELLNGVTQAIRRINKSGYLCIVVTNQPMIAKGFISFEELDRIHKKMETILGKDGAYLDAVYFCPHHPEKGFAGEVPELKLDCPCRKPKPGMLLKACMELNIDPGRSWMIGDSPADMFAGKSAGCKTIMIGEQLCPEADYKKNDLSEAVLFVLENKYPEMEAAI